MEFIASLLIAAAFIQQHETPAQRDKRILKEKEKAAAQLNTPNLKPAETKTSEIKPQATSNYNPRFRLQAEPLWILIGGFKTAAEFRVTDQFTLGPELFYANVYGSDEEYAYVGVKAKYYFSDDWQAKNSIYIYESTRWASLKIHGSDYRDKHIPGGSGEWLIQVVGLGWHHQLQAGTSLQLGAGYQMPLISNYGYKGDESHEDYYAKGLDIEMGISWSF